MCELRIVIGNALFYFYSMTYQQTRLVLGNEVACESGHSVTKEDIIIAQPWGIPSSDRASYIAGLRTWKVKDAN